MKKIYKSVEVAVTFFCEEDIVRTSQNDNVVELPEGGFSEVFGGGN